MHGAKVAQFILDIGLVGERLRDLLPQHFAESRPADAPPPSRRPSLVPSACAVSACDAAASPISQGAAPRTAPPVPLFRRQRGHRAIHHRDRPLAIKQHMRWRRRRIPNHQRRRAILAEVDDLRHNTAATFFPPRAIQPIPTKYFTAPEQIAAEPPRLGPAQGSRAPINARRTSAHDRGPCLHQTPCAAGKRIPADSRPRTGPRAPRVRPPSRPWRDRHASHRVVRNGAAGDRWTRRWHAWAIDAVTSHDVFEGKGFGDRAFRATARYAMAEVSPARLLALVARQLPACGPIALHVGFAFFSLSVQLSIATSHFETDRAASDSRCRTTKVGGPARKLKRAIPAAPLRLLIAVISRARTFS